MSIKSRESELNEGNKDKKTKEIISVEKISDNETIDHFFNDVSKIIDEKNIINVNSTPNKYTLFDDIDEESGVKN